LYSSVFDLLPKNKCQHKYEPNEEQAYDNQECQHLWQEAVKEKQLHALIYFENMCR